MKSCPDCGEIHEDELWREPRFNHTRALLTVVWWNSARVRPDLLQHILDEMIVESIVYERRWDVRVTH